MEPEFTIISPMYNVSRYLPEYFASLESQTYGFDRLEVILVDDGSTDDTAVVADAFASRHTNVRVIRKENGGQASARNVGIEHATGTWLTFPDPDDVLGDDYFARAHEAAGANATLAMISAKLLMWYEADGEIKDTHALTGRFRGGNSVRNLHRDPSWIQPHITSGFVRRRVVERVSLRFPEELRLRFEDGSFVARYLLEFEQPVVAFRDDMVYLYRQRGDSSSTIQSGAGNPRKYTDTIRLGYLPIIERLHAEGKPLPRWLQNLFLYDQFWILRSSQQPSIRKHTFPDDMHTELEGLLPRFLQALDEERIQSFDVMRVSPWMREALILVRRGDGMSPVYWGAKDKKRGLRSIQVRYRGDRPRVELVANGVPAEPRFQKVLFLEYVGRPLLTQLTLWVPLDADVAVKVDGEVQRVLEAPPTIHPAYPTPVKAAQHVTPQRVKDAFARRFTRNGSMNIARRLAMHSSRKRDLFQDAWVFIDKDVDAGDSAEDMYWWMHERHPEVNSWFVVRKGTRDWHRLERRGARLVDYGSPDFGALLHHASHLASSHADRFITDAVPKKHVPVDYTFTFLQHGVIKGDISGWLNSKTIDVFVTSTEDEYRYVSGESPFKFSQKEARLTGLPRFDVLAERAAQVPHEDRDLVLVMPTWRDYLVGSMKDSSADRSRVEDFSRTAYAQALRALLNSHELHSSLNDAGKRLVFMPHPNMRLYLNDFDAPSTVEVRSYADTDVREMICRSTALVTDYSSIAFNAAYLGTPTLYFQFDREEYAQNHTERPGYFDYARDGFGPIAETPSAAVSELRQILTGQLEPRYRDRMERTFPVRDGQNRQRVFEAMQEARRRRPVTELVIAAKSDHW